MKIRILDSFSSQSPAGSPASPVAPSQEVALAAFALLEKFDSGRCRPPPSIPKVFRLYCIDGLSAGAIARKCRCSKTAVMRRLNLIRKTAGLSPARLRRFAPPPPSLGNSRVARNNLFYSNIDSEGFSE
jgi:hypothetical protein